MRRCFAILLLALLPLQFSWAAVAGYCGHESDAQAQHLGHHQHQHQADAAVDQSDDSPAGKSLGSSDLDCAQCHGCCAGLPLPEPGVQAIIAAQHPATTAEGAPRMLAPVPPERPQWSPLA